MKLLPTFALFLSLATIHAADPLVTSSCPLFDVASQKAGGVYSSGEKIVWNVKLHKEVADAVTTASYIIRKGGLTDFAQGTLTFSNGETLIETSLNTPGTLLVEVTASLPGKEPVKALGGAAVDPGKIAVSAPAPDDFDAFWKAKIDELSAIPPNPTLERGDSGNPGVDYYKITLDNIHGTHVYGQLARPAKGDKFPAMLIVQYAGVYPLQKPWVIDPASKGWLVLNIIAHDLPIDKPNEFYDGQNLNELKNYVAIGNEDRETSYFLRMFLACYRAADYLAQRPDWDGRVLLVTGTSQGGLQSFVTAALHPKITALVVNVPAGCDTTGEQAGRIPGWPYWYKQIQGKDPKKVMETSRYFDAVNFAARVKCPALVALGLIDQTARPEGVLAAVNQLQGPKEVVVMPLASHKTMQENYATRSQAWKDALLHGQPVPVSPARE